MRDHRPADIARALVDLRQDLKRDLTEGLTREMDALRSEMRAIRSAAEGSDSVEDIRGEMQRLADSIGQLGRQASPAQADALRTEFNEMRALIDGLAREDSVRRMENRWTGVEQRLNAFDASRDDELVALAYRLDEIKGQIETVGNPKLLNALEDKLVTVAHAIESIGRQMQPDDHQMASRFAELDVRLDEISRAIISSGRTAGNADHAGVTRLENRMTDLARHVEHLATHRDDGLAMRLEALTARVEEIASDDSASRLDERLHQLAVMMERSSRDNDGQLDQHLADISTKIESLERGSLNGQLIERLDALARRIDDLNTVKAPDTQHSDARFERLEDQLATIAMHLAETQIAPRDDRESLRGLETQIANLSSLVASGGTASALPAEMESRMHALEDYLATSDEYIIEAARQAAEAVMEAYQRNGVGSAPNVGAGDISAISALADDLRSLETLSRSSEERTARTFEVLHETLVHIAEKLEKLEEGVERRVLAAEAAAAPRGSEPAQAPASGPRPVNFAEEDPRDPFGEAAPAPAHVRDTARTDLYASTAPLAASREEVRREAAYAPSVPLRPKACRPAPNSSRSPTMRPCAGESDLLDRDEEEDELDDLSTAAEAESRAACSPRSAAASRRSARPMRPPARKSIPRRRWMPPKCWRPTCRTSCWSRAPACRM